MLDVIFQHINGSGITMGRAAKTIDKKYTYADYLAWPDDERWEIIDGEAYDMTPSPSRRHQKISGELFFQLANYLRNKQCEVYAAPFDVRLAEAGVADESATTVVQPDISVICDKSKLDDSGCKGSPDLIIEIVSPSSARIDLKEKYLCYEKAGVREYWIVDPSAKTVTVFRSSGDGRFGRPDVYGEEERITVGIFSDLDIELEAVFRE